MAEITEKIQTITGFVLLNLLTIPQPSKQNGILFSLLVYSVPLGEEKALPLSVVISVHGNCFSVYHWYGKITNPSLVIKCAWILVVLFFVQDFQVSVIYIVLQCKSRLCASRSNRGMMLLHVCTKGLYHVFLSQNFTTDMYCRAVSTILQICTVDLYYIVCD